MRAALRSLADRLVGRGEAAITVPPFDGALKPNQLLETAEVFAELEAPEDLATDGRALFVADGNRVLRYQIPPQLARPSKNPPPLAGEGRVGDAAASPQPASIAANPRIPSLDPPPQAGEEEVARFNHPVTALACLDRGGLAVALDGTQVRLVGDPRDGWQWRAIAGHPLVAVNAIAQGRPGTLLITEGSRWRPYPMWRHDLMENGRSGRLLELDLDSGDAREIASNLAYAFGAAAAPDGIWVSESWRHRVLRCAGGVPAAVLDRLPGYPSRLSPASGGGFWLTVFTARTQLVEFVLREHAYRKRMMREIAPEYWVAPALSSGSTYLEPMQGAHIKTMGILKPWAPPRSYGLVIRLAPDGLMRYSLHSRVDGHNHGVVAAVECQGNLYVLAKGARRILRVSIADAERELLK